MEDNKIRQMIEKNFFNDHRSLFIIIGEHCPDSVVVLHKTLSQVKVKTRPSVLWYFKDNPKFSLNKKIGRLQKLVLAQSLDEKCNFNTNDPLECFMASTNIRYCNYSKTNLIFGQTFGMAVLQDFEALTPNLLARTAESVERGGIIVFLLQTVKALKQLEIVDMLKNSVFEKSRFYKRLCSTFQTSNSCVILDDKMNILHFPKNISHHHLNKSFNDNQGDIQNNLDEELMDDRYSGLSKACCTVDQTKFLFQCLDSLKKNSTYSVVSASSPTGRGKSAVLGLAIAGAIDMKYSNIFVSSLSFDNVPMVFKFILKGLDALNYEEGKHYDIIKYDNPMFDTAVLSLNIFKDHPQAVRFIYPGEDVSQLKQAELVVIDEAAAIPLTLLKKLIGPYVVLMASSTKGCGASGKFLYENMVKEIKHPSSFGNKQSSVSLFPTSERNTLIKVELDEPLNYGSGDGVEKWINHSLCLDSSQAKLTTGAPPLELCRLFYICRDTLFSYESHAEKFLQQLMSMFLCSKRKISPDDLLTMADSEDYHLFCLLPPPDNSGKTSHEILCAILVHKVKQVPWNIVYCGVNQPNPLPDSFNDWISPSDGKEDFLPIEGIRIVDIVTHPTYKHLGFDYDHRALQLLQEFYCGKFVPLDDKPFLCSTEQNLPLLLQLTEVEPEKAEYVLVSFYLTPQLLRFWKKAGFVPMYITSEMNCAQEHTCIMMKDLGGEEILSYMKTNWSCFVDEYSTLLASCFKYFSSIFALELMISPFSKQVVGKVLTKEDIDILIKPQRMKALEKYCRNLGDLHSVLSSINILSELYFRNLFTVDVDLTAIQKAILLSFGLQHKTINEISKDIDLPSTQVHAKLNQTVRRLTKYLDAIIEKEIEKTIPVRDVNMVPVSQSLDEELEEEAKKIKEKQAENLKKLKEMDFSEFAIKGSEEDWEKALHTGRKTLVSIKSLKKAPENIEVPRTKSKKEEKNRKRRR